MRHSIKPAGIITAVLISCSLLAGSQPGNETGKVLFNNNCAKCHGEDGTRGRWGAKNLQTTRLGNAEMQAVISNGRGIMPRWSKKLNPTQVGALVAYIRTLKQQ